MKKTQPIFAIGNFGTHIMRNPAGTFSFVGTVPVELKDVISKTYDEAITAFVTFFKSLSVSEQRDNISNLRNDVFKIIMEG